MNYIQRIGVSWGHPQGSAAPALQTGMELWANGSLPTMQLHFGSGKSLPDSG